MNLQIERVAVHSWCRILLSLCNNGDNTTDSFVCCVIAIVHDYSGTAFIDALCRFGVAFSVSDFSSAFGKCVDNNQGR